MDWKCYPLYCLGCVVRDGLDLLHTGLASVGDQGLQPEAPQMSDLLPVVAIDPGHEGACVVLAADGKTAVATFAWIRRKRKAGPVYVVDYGRSDWDGKQVEFEFDDLNQVGRRIAREVNAPDSMATDSHLLVVEGLFVPRPSQAAALDLARPRRQQGFAGGAGAKYLGQVARVLKLAEAGALVAGPLLSGAVSVERPTAGKWRPAILGLPANASSDDAEALAIRMMTAAKPPLVAGLGDLARNPHVAEAACIAKWGHVLLKERAKEAIRG